MFRLKANLPERMSYPLRKRIKEKINTKKKFVLKNQKNFRFNNKKKFVLKNQKKIILKKKDVLFLISFLLKKRKVNLLKDLEKKTSLYSLVKYLQDVKIGNVSFPFLELNHSVFCESKFLINNIERKKMNKFPFLCIKIENLLKKRFVKDFKNSYSFLYFSPGRLFTKGFKSSQIYSFLKNKYTIRKPIEEKKVLVNLLKKRSFLKRKMFRRLFGYQSILSKKKKYKSIVFFLRKNKTSLQSLSLIYKTNSIKFLWRKKKRKRMSKKLVRKRSRRKKKFWRRRGVFKLFRLRYRFRNKFYIPKHFEINYKTGEIIYLGYTHFSSLYFDQPFFFNLRRLVTFFSS